jgi:hypothetical protein
MIRWIMRQVGLPVPPDTSPMTHFYRVVFRKKGRRK